MKNGYEQTYDVIAPRLVECDFSDAARRLGKISPFGEGGHG
jgi:hypothetical protein